MPWSTTDLVGRRTLLFGFDPKAAEASLVADAIAAVADQQEAHNFAIVGVARTDAAQARAFLGEKGLRLRSFLDPSGTLGQRIGVRQPVWLILTDAQGNLSFGTEYFPNEGADPASAIAATLREELRLPGAAVASAGRPLAPDFSAERLEGGPPLTLSSLRGQPAVLIFFLHTCPHCHEALAFLKDALAALPEASRPKLLGVSVANRTWSVQEALRERDLEFFPVVLDPDASIRSAYSALQGVPVLFLIDAEGRLVSRTDGWSAEREPALLRMRLAKLAGQPVPMLLHKTGYSGNDVCGICHEDALATWELTNHASAYDTLVRHGADHDGECVSCHVVGYGESGGFSLAQPNENLEDVGCETCHGRGGPHLSPEHAGRQDYEALCRDCHNPEHSLGFEYKGFLPRVSHAANRNAFIPYVAAHHPRAFSLPFAENNSPLRRLERREEQSGHQSTLIWFTGLSGSGKTTLLNIIGGLDSATSGQIFFEDEEISAYSEEKMAELRLHDIGFIFQAYNLIHVLTVRENIGFIMKLLKFDEKEIDAR
ncbi:MAG: redoxin domain-containing protein, partial [Myxococcota bacterium]